MMLTQSQKDKIEQLNYDIEQKKLEILDVYIECLQQVHLFNLDDVIEHKVTGERRVITGTYLDKAWKAHTYLVPLNRLYRPTLIRNPEDWTVVGEWRESYAVIGKSETI